MSKNLDQLIKIEQEKIDGFQEKKDDLDKKSKELGVKIKACQQKIDKYTLTKNSQLHTELTDKLKDSGLSFDDIMLALKDGDMLSLQEKMEEAKANNHEQSV